MGSKLSEGAICIGAFGHWDLLRIAAGKKSHISEGAEYIPLGTQLLFTSGPVPFSMSWRLDLVRLH